MVVMVVGEGKEERMAGLDFSYVGADGYSWFNCC